MAIVHLMDDDPRIDDAPEGGVEPSEATEQAPADELDTGYDIYDAEAEARAKARAPISDEKETQDDDDDDLIEELFEEDDADEDSDSEEEQVYDLTVQQLVDAERAEQRYFDYMKQVDDVQAKSARNRYRVFIAGALAACCVLGAGVYEMVDDDSEPKPQITCAQQIERSKDAHAERVKEAIEEGRSAPEYKPPACAPDRAPR